MNSIEQFFLMCDLVVRCGGIGFAQVGIGPLLVFDALLYVLVVEVELFDAVVGAEAGVVAGDDFGELCDLYCL